MFKKLTKIKEALWIRKMESANKASWIKDLEKAETVDDRIRICQEDAMWILHGPNAGA